MHVFGLCEEAREHGENPHRRLYKIPLCFCAVQVGKGHFMVLDYFEILFCDFHWHIVITQIFQYDSIQACMSGHLSLCWPCDGLVTCPTLLQP